MPFPTWQRHLIAACIFSLMVLASAHPIALVSSLKLKTVGFYQNWSQKRLFVQGPKAQSEPTFRGFSVVISLQASYG